MNVRISQRKETEKTRHSVISVADKLAALKSIDDGVSKAAMALKMGVDASTIRRWIAKRKNLEEWSSHDPKNKKHRSRMQDPRNVQLNEAVTIWFHQQRQRGLPISGPIIRMQAMKFNKNLGGAENFVASEGWLHNWKKANGVRELIVSGEKLSADTSKVSNFIDDCRKIIDEEDLTEHQIFNADETGLYYRLIPHRTLVAGIEKSAPGYKTAKDRITIMACSNRSGTLKLPLMVIGKSAKPRAFKDIHPSNMPVYYRSQKSAWMNTALFEEWFKSEFVPRVTEFLKNMDLPLKAVLLLDNASSHRSSECLAIKEIRTLYLPPNVTSLIQPMDQGVLENLKRRYKRSLLTKLVNESMESNVLEALKNINMKDVIFWIAASWDELPVTAIRKSWNKIIPIPDTSDNSSESRNDGLTNNDLLSLLRRIGSDNITGHDIQEWVTAGDSEMLNDNDILSMVTQNSTNDEIIEEAAASVEITHEVAQQACESLISYFQKKPVDLCRNLLIAFHTAKDLITKLQNQ